MRNRLLRRAIILCIVCPPIVGLTQIGEKTAIEERAGQDKHSSIQRVGSQILIPQSQSYLDLNPSF